MPSRAPRNRTAYSLLIGIILLASIGYVCGFVALWIRPETVTEVTNPRPTATSVAVLQPTGTLGTLPTQFVPPQPTATQQATPTLAASPTKIPATPTVTTTPTLPPLPTNTLTPIPIPTDTLVPTVAPLPTDTATAPVPTDTATPDPNVTLTAIP